MAVEASYDGDLALWAKDQARALRDAGRARVNLPIDWENVAEEIEAFGKSQGRELAATVRALGYPASMDPGEFADTYRRTTRRARAAVERLFYA